MNRRVGHCGPGSRARGFTLVELLVASIIGVLIVGATTVALSRLLRIKVQSEARREAFARAEAGVARIAADVLTVVRDTDLLNARILVTDGSGDGAARDELLLFCRSLRRVRGLTEYPEGAEFEVQYRVEPRRDEPALWRRADPIPDFYADAGGVAAPIADGVTSFNVEAHDGEDWYEVWDSDYDGYPHGLRVTVTAQSPRGEVLAMARRTIAIDRVPLAAASATVTEGASPVGATTTGGGR